MAKNHEISVYFWQKRSSCYVTHSYNYELQNVLVSKRRMLLNWKVVNRYKLYKFGTSYA